MTAPYVPAATRWPATPIADTLLAEAARDPGVSDETWLVLVRAFGEVTAE